MRITFVGAAGGVVTGSCHLLEAQGKRVLLDCGMVQGSRDAEAQNQQPFAFDATTIDALVLSHAHIDHIGRVPLLVKRGFKGPIFSQAATCDLLPPEQLPIYTKDDVAGVLKLLHPLPYDSVTEILPGLELRLHEAGHILGSAIVEVRSTESGATGIGASINPGTKTLLFSGDIGMRGTPILRDPATPPATDLVLMESTYGDRNHKDRAATVAELGAIFAAAKECREDGIDVRPEVMIPLVGTVKELELTVEMTRRVAAETFKERGIEIPVIVGTMIEIPRAALIAEKLGAIAEFFSFGTNDLTQMTFGYSRDDAGSFLPDYVDKKILPKDPFESIDVEGVGQLVKLGTERGRSANPKLKVGVCGEHGGDPDSIRFFRSCDLNYVSCSPYRVPVARLAAAQAELELKAYEG